MTQSTVRFFLLICFVCLLAACGKEVVPPTLIATAVPVQTFTPLPTLSPTPKPSLTPAPPTAVPTATPVLQYPTNTPAPSATPPPTATTMALRLETVIGKSVQERPLTAYQFKNGPNQVVIIGGLHGGYEWNTVQLAYEALDYFSANPDAVPDSVSLHIIPNANPDGLALVAQNAETTSAEDFVGLPLAETLPGRVNANQVDLNRNWDCNWYRSAYWQDQWVSGGDEPFSEPETVALRDFLLAKAPQVVVLLHSAANGVFASGCNGAYAPSLKAASVYGLAAGYPVQARFSAYSITGDAGDWLAAQKIPAFAVELSDHDSLDMAKNLAGMRALLDAFR